MDAQHVQTSMKHAQHEQATSHIPAQEYWIHSVLARQHSPQQLTNAVIGVHICCVHKSIHPRHSLQSHAMLQS
jgi:hypothetical protein